MRQLGNWIEFEAEASGDKVPILLRRWDIVSVDQRTARGCRIVHKVGRETCGLVVTDEYAGVVEAVAGTVEV